MGLSVVKENVNQCYIKVTIWTNIDNSDKPSTKNYDLLLKVNCEDDNFSNIYDICFSFKKNKKEFSVYCNGSYSTQKYEGELLDYSNTWLWVGCSNAFDECDPQIRNFFHGEIFELIICNKSYEKTEIEKFFNKKLTNLDIQNITCMFDFKEQTDYKVLDLSKNGNHLMKYERSWF